MGVDQVVGKRQGGGGLGCGEQQVALGIENLGAKPEVPRGVHVEVRGLVHQAVRARRGVCVGLGQRDQLGGGGGHVFFGDKTSVVEQRHAFAGKRQAPVLLVKLQRPKRDRVEVSGANLVGVDRMDQPGAGPFAGALVGGDEEVWAVAPGDGVGELCDERLRRDTKGHDRMVGMRGIPVLGQPLDRPLLLPSVGMP